jgi:hypothetical protein
MSRQKTYYTADETTNNLFTKGKQWMTTDNIEYKGAYHRYLTGEIYTQTKWNSKTSKKLIPYISPSTFNKSTIQYRKLKPKIKTKFKSFQPGTTTITTKNIASGILNRYFVKKYDNEIIFETDKATYDSIFNNLIDNKLYTKQQIKWYITGPKQDQFTAGATKKGVVTKNTEQINLAKVKLTGIAKLLTDPLQYYTDTDFIKPTDINGLDS